MMCTILQSQEEGD